MYKAPKVCKFKVSKRMSGESPETRRGVGMAHMPFPRPPPLF